MLDSNSEAPVSAQQRQRALASWENEGGAGPDGPLDAVHLFAAQGRLPEMGEAEMVAMHVRVVARENLMIALLATASIEQLQVVRDMASYILPRSGATPHPLTTLAAGHMTDLVQRAARVSDEG